MSNTYGPRIVSDGLVLHIDAANPRSYDGSSTTWYNLAPYQYSASLANGPTFSSSNKGRITLDGSNDYISANNDTLKSLFPTTKVSHFTWCYPISQGQIVAELGQLAINTGWHDSNIEISSGGVFSISTWDGSLLSNKVVSSAYSFNNWYYVGFSYDGTALTAYINGKSIGSVTFARVAPYLNGYELYYALGAIDSTAMGTSAYCNMNISSFKLYNRNITADEVKQNYNATKGRFNL